MRYAFLLLAIIGAVVPYIFFLMYFTEHGIALEDFIGALFSNGASGGFTSDVLISSLVFWLFLVKENVSRIWVYVLINLTIGLSCALPLYLYVRYRSLAVSDQLV